MKEFKIGQLPKVAQEQLLKWDKQLTETPEGGYAPRGLWVAGPRGVGSTFLAYNAWMRANQVLQEEIRDVSFAIDGVESQYTADDLRQLLRSVWDLSKNAEKNANDDALWWEFSEYRQKEEWFFNISPSVFVDDLHHAAYDGQFWKRHIWPRLEGKIKRGHAVVVASDMQIGDVLGGYWHNFFVACPADGVFDA